MRSARGIFQWNIPAHRSEEATRLYKNELHFTLPEFGGGVTVIDEDTHYSVHVDSDLSPELLPLIWDDTSQGISDVCSQLSLTVTHSIGLSVCVTTQHVTSQWCPQTTSHGCAQKMTQLPALSPTSRNCGYQWKPTWKQVCVPIANFYKLRLFVTIMLFLLFT